MSWLLLVGLLLTFAAIGGILQGICNLFEVGGHNVGRMLQLQPRQRWHGGGGTRTVRWDRCTIA